ncbi:MAG: IclR family transcriptional regulator [Oscillospiraceae bacterium]
MLNDMNEKPANQFVTKLLQLITNLAESRTPMRLQEIASGAGMPQATALRYLNALIQEGYVFQDMVSGRYALTWRICSLGDLVRTHSSLRTLSGGIVNELSAKLTLGICLVVEHDMECMYLDCVYEPAAMGQSLQRIGKQTPLHSTGSGKILLTGYSEADIDRLIAQKKLTALTARTITTKNALLKEITRVKEQGYALDDEECEEGLRCVSVPIWDYSGKVSAAISAFGSADKVTDSYIQECILPTMKTAASEISFRIGYNNAEISTCDTPIK